MKSRIAFLFPGQGSQYVGMGKDLAEKFSSAREIFTIADEICGKSISTLCFDGPLEDLTVTETLQPAVVAVDLAILELLRESGLNADVSAGHSVGEYAALVSAGVIDPGDAIRLAGKRGQLMHREAVAHPGGMAAVLGLDLDAVQRIVEEVQGLGVLDAGNHNAPGQVVITGEIAPLEKAVSLVRERKGKAKTLKVSGAWHSRLMAGGVAELRAFMDGVNFRSPVAPMIFNATAGTETDPETIKEMMAWQLVRPVYWYDTVKRMEAEGVDVYVEVGPKNVLANLVKKILPAGSGAAVYNVQDVPGMESLISVLG